MTLHEAARRGSLDDLRRLLASQPVDGLDHFNMSALAWAVAYGREDAALLLLRAGAASMPEGTSGQDVTPVLAAISQRRVELLRQLARPQQYSRIYVHSAIRSNDAAIVLAVLGAPHETIEPLSISALTSAPISLEVAEALIALKGQQAANAVLYEGAQKGRLELVQLGLARGADANAADSSGKTPLFVALDSYQFDPLPIVDALLKAGADVNQPPRCSATIWMRHQRQSG